MVLTTIPSDAHTWNLAYLELLLHENGFSVNNLGNCPDHATIVSAAASPKVSAVVVSTVNGLGAVDGMPVMRALREDPRTKDVPVVIGGKLTITGAVSPQDVTRLRDAGASEVLADEPASALVDWLRRHGVSRRMGSCAA